MVEPRHFDDIVVGAGIVGLAHAYHLCRMRRRVLVLERNRSAAGASIRNFGMIWPVGQPAGEPRDLAMRSREHWLAMLSDSGIWHERAGSLHLAYHDDEMAVLQEFAKAENPSERELVDPATTLQLSPAIVSEGLLGAMHSRTEICVDPRQVISVLPDRLSSEYGVEFRFGMTATACQETVVTAGGTDWRAQRIWLCTGDDLQTLFPNLIAQSPLTACKLQMMRTTPDGNSFRIGPMLAAGLTLTHYGSFKRCASLPRLRERFEREMPDYVRHGIHVMASQNASGEITIGDSHEYGPAIQPFDSPEIDSLILDYLATFLRASKMEIRSRWHGFYVKHPTLPYVALDPVPGVTIVTGLGGAGMTLSFGVAEKVIRERL